MNAEGAGSPISRCGAGGQRKAPTNKFQRGAEHICPRPDLRRRYKSVDAVLDVGLTVA